MPKHFQEWGESWVAVNPGWEMKLWTEKNLPPTESPMSLEAACHLSQVSNIYRFEVLKHEGGVYVDTDMLALRPLDGLLEGVKGFVGKSRRGVGSAIMGCEQGDEVAVDLVQSTPTMKASESLSLGSHFVRNVLNDHPGAWVEFPIPYMYPLDFYDWRKLWKAGHPLSAEVLRVRFPQAIACHFWSSRWHKPGFAPLNEISAKRCACTIPKDNC
jgi:Mannosyltransferase OCH1 and related enzymes